VNSSLTADHRSSETYARLNRPVKDKDRQAARSSLQSYCCFFV